jgi:hypothetical protein
LQGAPPGWKPPVPPPTFNPNKEPKAAKGEPMFTMVDNPGNWDKYTFQPQFEKKTGKYTCHSLPTGARPCPSNAQGNRTRDGWEFHYNNGWYGPDDLPHRSGATRVSLRETMISAIFKKEIQI